MHTCIPSLDSKYPGVHVLYEWMPTTKTHPVCTIHEDGMWLPLWLDSETVTCSKISPKVVNPRGIADNAGGEEEGKATRQTILNQLSCVLSVWRSMTWQSSKRCMPSSHLRMSAAWIRLNGQMTVSSLLWPHLVVRYMSTWPNYPCCTLLTRLVSLIWPPC